MTMTTLVHAVWTSDRPQPADGAAWEALLAQARATRLSARLALRLDGEPGVPARIAAQLGATHRVCSALHVAVRHEIGQLARALAALDTPVVLLKGAAYVAAGLPAARGRLFSDIDILVRHERLDAVEQALFAGGWIAEKLTPYDERYYRQHMHELPPLVHVQRHSHLDVHHTLTPPTSRHRIDGQALVDRAVPLAGTEDWLEKQLAATLRVLSPADMVLHSAVHLMQDGEFGAGLRDLLDIHDLLRHFERADPAFWGELGRRTQELGLQRVVGHVLAQQQRLFGLLPAADQRTVFDAWQARGAGARIVQVLLPRVLAPLVPGAAPHRLARLAMYTRGHWLRMPWYQIVPHLIRKAWMRAWHRARRAEPPA